MNTGVNAQAPFSDAEALYVNNINALISVHGNLFWDKDEKAAHCYFPAKAATSINACAALWIAGYDDANTLHVSAYGYNKDSFDYWPGPLDASGSLNYSVSQNWSKIWKIKRTDIQIFQALAEHTYENTSSSILTWPAKGNIYAKGNSDVSLSISEDMAPFVDLNNNGIYEPLSGEYPDVPGDQALWWVYSDNGPTHNQTNGFPLGLEIHALAYGYKRGSLIDNVIYFNYKVINKSANNYHNLRIGAWDDPDLGYAWDDYIGFDSAFRMGIVYNGNNDDGAFVGHPPTAFGVSIPIGGMTIVSMPGDAGSNYLPAGSFTYYNNDQSVIGNPDHDTEYNNYLNSKIRTGIKLKGASTPGYCSGIPEADGSQYVLTGDPSAPDQFSQCNCRDLSNDIRIVVSTPDLTMNKNETKEITVAFIATNPDTLNGCPSSGFSQIKTVADTAWKIYHNPLSPIPIKTSIITRQEDIYIFPNPAHDQLFIENALQKTCASINIYNMIGQSINVPINQNNNKTTIDICVLAKGVYRIVYNDGTIQKAAKFVKE